MNNLSSLLTEQSARSGEQTFCFFEEEELSYASFEATSNALAHGLIAHKVKKGGHVAFLLPNIPEWLLTFYAAIKAGATAVPINSLLKAEEIRFILENSEARILITIPQFVEMIRELQQDLPTLREVFVLTDEAPRGMFMFDQLLTDRTDPPAVEIAPEDPACIIYTSGMTGRPKGAMLSHKNYLTNAKQLVQGLDITSRDRLLNILPMFHVNAQLVTFIAPLYAGASMVLMRGFSPRQFLPALDRYKATAFTAVPTVYAILNELPDAEDYDLSMLRFCICGAAPMPMDVFERFEIKYKTKIIEGYGLSEATCASSINPIRGKRKVGSIGRPLPGIEMKLVDESGKEVATGAEGEIIVRGDTVMLGYLNDAAATADTLRNGWLFTGDIGYVDEDGFFFIRGRKKDMIIRGGENIYPREVEDVLIQHPEIKEVAVVGKPDPIWGEEVTAYVVVEGRERPSRTQLMEFARQHLADYKCPTSIVFVESLPKTAMMKVRRWALREE